MLAFFDEDTSCASGPPGSVPITVIISVSVVGVIILVVIILVAVPQIRHTIFPKHDVDDFAVSSKSTTKT